MVLFGGFSKNSSVRSQQDVREVHWFVITVMRIQVWFTTTESNTLRQLYTRERMRMRFDSQEENTEHGAWYGYENRLGIVIYTGGCLRMIVSDRQL